MTEGEGRLGRRLNRILLMLPYAIRHPGVTVEELSKRFGVRRRELMEDLNLVFLCGLPGYGPGDLIDVEITEDRVYVGMADYFAAPLRLTPAEALALYAGGAAIAGLPAMEEANALRSAIAKLGRAIGANGRSTGGLEVAVERGPTPHVETLRRALDSGVQVDLEYRSASRGELTQRTIDPWGLVAALGRWYLVAWDHLTSEERLFRVDRIKSAKLLGTPAAVPSDFDAAKYRGAFSRREQGSVVSFEISPQTATWFGDYYPVKSSEELPDGWQRVQLYSSGDRWAATLTLRLGLEARALNPKSVHEEARRLATAIAARYR